MFYPIGEKFSISYSISIAFGLYCTMMYTVAVFFPLNLTLILQEISSQWYLFLDASIHSILIIQSFPKALWGGIHFTFAIVYDVYCSSILQCGTNALWLNGSNVLPHMVSSSVFLFLFLYNAGCFCVFKIGNIHLG